jgi:hypothetical protein
VILCAVGVLLWWGRVGRVVEVEVEVRYAVPVEARAGLRHLSLTWTPDGDDVPAATGHLRVPPYGAPAVHTQSLALRPGAYIVTARFEYADGTARTAQAAATISRGEGPLTVALPVP